MAIRVGGDEVISNQKKVIAEKLSVEGLEYATKSQADTAEAGQALVLNAGKTGLVFADAGGLDAEAGPGIKFRDSAGQTFIDADVDDTKGMPGEPCPLAGEPGIAGHGTRT